MRIAIIDLGTNTFNLLVADVMSRGEFKTIFSTKIAVKLGEGGIGKSTILPAAFERGINALRSHRAIIDKLKAQKVIAFATSAIRSAQNGAKFVAAAKKETGIGIQVIPGDREAELIAAGVRLALDLGDTPSLILDIGGGSNECIIATRDNILWKQSFEMGVARLLEKFKPSDPVTAGEIEAMENYFREGLRPLFEAVKQFPVAELVGASGSFDTFSAMIAHQFHSPDILKGRSEYVFDMNEYAQVHGCLLRSTEKERYQTPGIIALRVDMIVIASVLVNFLIRELGLTAMRMSTYSLKQGVLAEVMQNY
jgi:exopolyphosphatase/guanosine-5'-triphosphate,3'-diphosphate pyrophosphatase